MIEYLLLAAAIFAIYWTNKTRNRMTQFAGFMLALSVILGYISFGGIRGYAPYAYAFFSLFAAFEPVNSFKFKTKHKSAFIYSGVIAFAVTGFTMVTLPFAFPIELLMIPVPLMTIWLWKKEKKVVYQRISFLVIWSVQALIELYNCLIVRGELSEFF